MIFESHTESHGARREAKATEWNVVSDADTVVVHRNGVPSETGIMRTRHGRADVRGKAVPRHPIRTAGPDIVLGTRRLPAPAPLPVPGIGERLWGSFRHPGPI